MKINVDYRDFQPKETCREGESTEWTIHYVYDKMKTGLPRVLSIGDSICNGYSYSLEKILPPDITYAYWASSLCVTDPMYFKTLELILASTPETNLITFNNGLHSVTTTPRKDWCAAYIQAVRFLHAAVPNAKLLLVNCTPGRDVDNNAKVAEMNTDIDAMGKELGVKVIDLFSFCDPWPRDEAWRDSVHFTVPYLEKQGEFLKGFIRTELGLSCLN